MTNPDLHIIPYTPERQNDSSLMEKDITQGRFIQLEILKDHFLDRAKVFQDYYVNLAAKNDNQIIGNAIGAKTTLKINSNQFDAGFGFDAKVIAAFRKNGVAKMLAKDLYKNFFRPRGLHNCFMTAKLNNGPILKVVSKALSKVWLYPFVYLTIPTGINVKGRPENGIEHQKFSVALFDRTAVKDLYTYDPAGLSYLHTWKIYQLKVKKVNWFYQNGLAVAKKLGRNLYKHLPARDAILSFATLFDHNGHNIEHINLVLNDLRKKGIDYLLVCCQKNDGIYKFLKSSSINTYNYCIVTDFAVNNDDAVTIDVRCL